VFASAEDEQTEECDVIASQKNEYETGDSEADPLYSLSDYSYSDTSDNNSSSFHELAISAVNEPQNIDLTTEKENRKPKRRKIKTAMPSEWRRDKTKLLRNAGHANRTF
jgi:hypothetical protein